MNFKKLIDILIELKLNQMEKSLALLNDFNLEEMTVPEKSFYLWLKIQATQKIEAADEFIIDEIIKSWNKPQPNLLNEQADMWTSNLANYYACLGEVKNTGGISEVQKTMTDVRDFIFDNMIKGSSLYGQLSTKEVTYEQLLSVLPFGLFAPEDLIVVAAHETLSLRATDNPISNAIFGIYFTEKFELDHAKFHLEKALEFVKKDSVCKSLVNLLQIYMKEKTGDQAVEFIHKPLGHFNVYDTLKVEKRVITTQRKEVHTEKPLEGQKAKRKIERESKKIRFEYDSLATVQEQSPVRH